MTYARIFSPSKTSMQSGKAKTGYWLLQFNDCDAKFKDPVMGWNGSQSTVEQVTLKFSSLKAALDYAAQAKIEAIVDTQHFPKIQIKSYSDNFRYDKPRG